MKLGRNKLCHCGSGKKYKFCHLPIEEGREPRSPRPHRATPPAVEAEYKGELLGKKILVTTDTCTYSAVQLHRHLARFNLPWTLRLIGELGTAVEDKPAIAVDGVPVTRHCLAYLALAAIESSSDDAADPPSHADVALAARMYNGMVEPRSPKGRGMSQILLRMAFQQFGQPVTFNSIARNWSLYGATWKRCEKARTFDIAAAIRKVTGLSLAQHMALVLAYTARSAPGYCKPYPSEALKLLSPSLGIGEEEHARFLDSITGSYDEIRRLASQVRTKPGFEKSRLNPLLVKPLVRPDRPPAPGADDVRVVPVPSYLKRRICDGLYHDLAFAHDHGGGENSFRVAFGHVFQAYVGELLEAGAGDAEVLPEWSYGSKRSRRDTPDWMVLDGERLVIVEVKQSAVTLDTKAFGSLEMLTRDLQSTLARGVKQLCTFRSHLREKTVGLERLNDVREVELMLVTHDPISWSNWIVRDALVEAGYPEAVDVHFLTIEEFENLQRYCWGKSPFGLLRAKRTGGTQAATSDMREWLSKLGEPPDGGHPHLAALFKDFEQTWMPSPSEADSMPVEAEHGLVIAKGGPDTATT